MLSFERELERLRPLLPSGTADALIARERREVFSVRPELRIVAWAGTMLLAAAAGIVLKNNLDRIGPLALAALTGAVAIACYAFVWLRRARPSLIDEYVLLLGALLVSADVAFIETQFHLFGDAWYRHFLVLAIVHGVTAYLYRSRTLLTLSIVAMSSWLGVQQLGGFQYDMSANEISVRLLGCLAMVMMWRHLNRRAEFKPVFEHFAVHFLMLAPFVQVVHSEGLRVIACLLTMIAAGIVIHLAFRLGRESFAIYGLLYFLFAFNVMIFALSDSAILGTFVGIISTVGAIVALFVIHNRFREMHA